MKMLFLITLLPFLFLQQTFSQTTSITQLETDISQNRIALSDSKLDAAKREKLFRELASQINELAESHFEKGEFEVATKLFVEAEQFSRQHSESYFSRRKEDLIAAENKLVVYEKEENLTKKELLYKAGRIYVYSLLSDLITTAENLHDHESENTFLQKLLTISHELQDSSAEAKAYEKLGVLELNADHPNQAFELYDKAFKLRQTKNEEWWTVDYIAFAHWTLGEYDKALEQFDKEISLLQSVQSKPIDPKFSDFSNLTLTDKELKEMQEQRMVTLEMERLNVTSSLASALLNKAKINIARGKYGEASAIIRDVEKIIEQLKDKQRVSKDETLSALITVSIGSHEASSLRIHARILEAEGMDSLATPLYSEAIKIFSDLSGGGASGAIAAMRSRLASIYLNQNKFAEARSNCKEVLRLRAKLEQQEGAVSALILSSRIERAAQENQMAMKLARQAKAAALQLSNAEELLAEANENEADNLVDKAADQSSLELEQAIVGYKTAIAVYRQADLAPMLSRALSSLGWAYERSLKFKDAELVYSDAIKISESIKSGFSTSDESNAFSANKETIKIYQRMVDLLVRQGKTEQALQFASSAQRRNIIDAIPKGEIKLNSKSDKDLKNVIAAENRMTAVRSSIEKEKKENHSSTTHDNLVSDLGVAREQYAISIKRLESEQPNVKFTVRPTDLLKLQSSIGNGEAILSYLVTPEKLYIFVVKNKIVAVRSVDVTQDKLRGIVGSIRTCLTNFANDFYALSFDPSTGFNIEKDRPDIRKPDTTSQYRNFLLPLKTGLNDLYDILIQPVEDLLDHTETLKIIPNSELFLLPYSALLSANTDQYLIEKYNILYLTAGDLISIAAHPSKGSLVAFGDPTDANLEGALEEVKAIQAVFRGSKIYTDSAATKRQLFKLKDAKILHFATHGHIRSPLESSNIQLAHLPGITDSDLSYGEIYALPIESSEMVVLSACQTALGTVSGTEIGVFIEAFRSKTNTVVASLWSVDDLATLELMTNFYKDLQAGKSKPVAMRNAQIKLLKDNRTKNPLFWSAFVMYGDGGKISGTGISQH